MKVFKLSYLAEIVDGVLYGEDIEIAGINAIPLATERELIFIDTLKRVEQALNSRARAVLCPQGFKEYFKEKSVIEVKNVRVAFAKLTYLFRKEDHVNWSISEKAIIEDEVEIEKPCAIYPNVYIQKGAKIRKGVVLYPGVFVGAFSEIGDNTVIYPYAVIYPYTKIGKNCIIHAGVVIGADGFGFAQEELEEGFKNIKIYHFGRVRVEDDVEIGANSTIDRAVFGETTVGEGTKIDNLVQVGHNVRIGKQNILVSHVAIGGSAVLEDYVMLAGQVGIAPYAKIGKEAKVAAKSGVVGEIPPKAEVAGIPAIEVNTWRKAVIILKKLPELYKELKKLLKTS